MKMKNVSFLEKHVEKMIFGLGALFLLVVIWFYALFPQRVEVSVGSQKRQASPGQIEQLVRQEADDLERKLKNATPPEQLVNMQVPPYAQNLQQQITAPVARVARLTAPLGQSGLDPSILGVGGQGLAAAVKYNIPVLPVPDKPVARADFAVLAEVEQPRLRSAWLKALDLETPGDFRYVSVASAFDMGQWQKSLRQGSQPRIPEEWWRGQLLVTEVVLEREILNSDTGKWGGLTKVARIPTQAGFTAMQNNLAPENVNALLTRMRARQPLVLRPRLEPITMDRTWFPPTIDPDTLSPRQREQAREVLRVMRGIEEQIEREIIGGADLGGEDDVFTLPGSASPTPAQYPGGFYNPDAANMTPENPDNYPTAPTMDFNVTVNPGETFEVQLDELQKRLKLVLEGKDLTALDAAAATALIPSTGPTSPTGPRDIRQLAATGNRPPAPGSTPPGSAAGNAPREVGKLQITVHDVTAQPGKTYRYRIKVGVYNPLFRKAGVVAAQRTENFDRLALLSAPTDWTDPVVIEPQRRFFLVSASPEQRSSKWEVWRIYRGRWIHQEFLVRPGDPIGAVVPIQVDNDFAPVSLDMSVAAALVDVQAMERYVLGSTQRALVLDTEDGRMFERIVSRDRDDKARDRLLRSLPKPEVTQPQPEDGFDPNAPPRPGTRRPGMNEEERYMEEGPPPDDMGGSPDFGRRPPRPPRNR